VHEKAAAMVVLVTTTPVKATTMALEAAPTALLTLPTAKKAPMTALLAVLKYVGNDMSCDTTVSPKAWGRYEQ